MSSEIASYNDITTIEGLSVPAGTDLSLCPSRSEIENIVSSGFKVSFLGSYSENQLVAISDIEIESGYPTILFILNDNPGATRVFGLCHSNLRFTGTTMNEFASFYNSAKKDHAELKSGDKVLLKVSSETYWFMQSEGIYYYLVVFTTSQIFLYEFRIADTYAYRLNNPEEYGYDHQETLSGNKTSELAAV